MAKKCTILESWAGFTHKTSPNIGAHIPGGRLCCKSVGIVKQKCKCTGKVERLVLLSAVSGLRNKSSNGTVK